MIDTVTPPAGATKRRPWLLAAGVLAIGLVWLGVLPWVETLPPVARHIRCQDEAEVDPSALFYTELPLVQELAHRREVLGGAAWRRGRWLHAPEKSSAESR
ncbi:MAG: hypothetical protein KatS3mg110_2724 [Pirellulaceae bacterium]|nr:MAG: hypothetical protein KatS3mg110_2724 [Pirellulaceae bacterium]